MQTASASVTVPVSTENTTSDKSAGSPQPSGPKQRTGRYRPHAFFDNPPSCSSGASTPISPVPGCKGTHSAISTQISTSLSHLELQRSISRQSTDEAKTPASSTVAEVEIGAEARIAFAHFGYIYALHLIQRPEGENWLVSGSGDSDIKIWSCRPSGGLSLVHTFGNLSGAVHSLAFRDSLLFAGMQDGQIGVWDLETGACIRKIEVHDSDVLALSVLGDDLYTGAADGIVARINGKFESTATWGAHDGIVLSSCIVSGKHGWELITAGNDSSVKVSS